MDAARADLLARLKKTFGELAGQDLGSVESSAGFLDLGFDSLFLTQAAAALKSRFGVKVTFRQLIDDLSSFDALASYLQAKLPPPAATTPSLATPAAAPAPAATPTPPARQVAPVPSPAQPAAAPAAWTPPPPPPGPVTLPSGERSLTSTVLERVIQEQLRVMEQQLGLLRRSTPGRFEIPTVPTQVPSAAEPPAVPAALGSAFADPPALAPAATASAAETATPMAQHGPFRPVDKGAKGGLTPQQQAHLDWLIARYLVQSPKSKAYTQRHRKHFADPRAVAGFKQNWKEIVYPIVSTRSAGAYLWDLDDRRWVDVTLGFGVGLLGHSPAFITEAVKRQLDLGVEIGPQSPLAGEVAELICEFTGMERVTFCNTGSEAVMAALRLCRTVTGRTKVVLFAGAYHGTFDEVLVKGTWLGGQPKTLPIAPGIAPSLVSEIVVLEYGTERSLGWLREHAGELAAVLVETVQSRHPDLQPREFLQEVRRITEAAETPLIFDEVITGFRCHPGGAQAYFGIRADLATYGKVIGGGMPLGFIAGRAEFMDALDGGAWQYGDDSFPTVGVTFFAGTFVRHPLAMAAAKAMLLYLKDQGPQLQANLAARTDRFIGELNEYFARHQTGVHLEHFTSVWYPHFAPEVKFGSLLYFHLREKGVHIWEGRPCFLSTAHTPEDEAFIRRAFLLSVAEMQDGGFLPGTSDPEYVEEVRRRKSASPVAAPALETPPTTVAVPAPAPVATPAPLPSEFPLSEAQREMWLAAQMWPEASGTHNATTIARLRGPLDPRILERAIHDVVARHEALRCTFRADGNAIVVGPLVPFSLPIHDLSALPPAAREARAQELLDQEGQRLFDLARGPLFAFQLIRLAPDEHWLVFSVQMIICDGWSYNLVLEDLSALYSAYVEGRTPLLEPAQPMREYVTLMQQEPQMAEAKRCGTYWVAQFQPPPTPLELPTFRPRPPTRSFAGARQTLRLSAGFYQGLKRSARKLNSTPFALLLATYQTWLFRLSGAEDLVVGVPFAGQGALGLELLVGQCLHTLPLRVQLSAEEPFDSLLRKARDAVVNAQENWCCSYGALVQQLDLPRDPSRIPLVSVLFNLDLPMSKVRFSGCQINIGSGPRFYYQYDLGFNLVDEGETLLIECDYNRGLFDGEIIQRWLGHFQTLLEGVMADPHQPVGRLPLVGAADRQQILGAWNATQQPLPPTATAHSLFSAQAARTPDRIAVLSESQSLTYGELERRANRLAHALRSVGVTPGSAVGLCLERGPDLVVGALGILKSGAAFVPVDLAFPAERVAYMLENASVTTLVTESTALPQLPATQARLICIDEDANVLTREEPNMPDLPADPDGLAYCLYTSGSSGQPKCVEVSHRALVNLLTAMQREPGLKPEDVMLALAPVTFDIAVMELLLPLVVGARVVVAPREAGIDPNRLMTLLDRTGVTVMQATPVAWRMLLAAGWTGNPRLKALCGGEALDRELADQLLDRCAELWNMYGPTETTIWSTTARVRPDDPITIGRPIANTCAYVLDPQLQPVPIGVPGELYLGGIGVARGYRNQPGLTSERFVHDPFQTGPGGRLYRTGDWVRYRLDGQLEYLGRRDSQTKIRGCRVEPAEVETLLRKDPQVRDGVVVVRPDASGQPALIAYLVLVNPATPPTALPAVRKELRRRLHAALPDYMIPSAFVVLDRFPLTSNRKVDRLALPPPPAEAFETSETYAAPQTPTEELLTRIWSQVLKLDRVSVRDNFFELGGQSLLAVSLFARIDREFGRRLPLAALLGAPTIEQLAALLDGRSAPSSAWKSLVPIQPAGSRTPLFLVHGAGGNVLLYRTLAQHLAPDYPLYGLQSQGLDGSSEPLRTIEAMAAHYIDEIRTVQPHGPYYLGGYCLGGTVAYEMAQRLIAHGETVALVAMLDTYNFSRALKPSFTSFILQKIRFHFGNFVRLRPRQMLLYLREKMRVARDGELANLMTSRPGSAPHGVARAESGVEASVQAVNDNAAEIYLPQPYSGRLALFKPHVNYKFYPDPRMGWGDLAVGGLDIVELPVNPHAMLVEPFVALLARELKLRLDPGSPPANAAPTSAAPPAPHPVQTPEPVV